MVYDYRVHPACALLPEIREKDFQKLKSSIQMIGQLQYIYLWDGQVIDGRARLRACKELGIEPDIAEYDMASVVNNIGGDVIDPESLVWAYNMNRRHYTAKEMSLAKTAFANISSQVDATHAYIEREWRKIAVAYTNLTIVSLFRKTLRLRSKSAV